MTQIREADQRVDEAAQNNFTSEGGFLTPTTDSAGRQMPSSGVAQAAELAADEARRRVMEEASVTFDGRRYYFHGHRYSGLADAIDHSILMRSQPSREHLPGPFATPPMVLAPADADTVLMNSLGIRFTAGMYCFETYRYDHLEDAIGYARLRAVKPNLPRSPDSEC